jgi:hypothetical protein
MRVVQTLRHKLEERGQALIVVAGLLPVLLGMAGIAIDYGSYASERRYLQNSADAIALAAAQELPDEDAAIEVAEDWADRNDLDLSDVSITISGGSIEPQVHVEIVRPHSFAFMPVLGVDERDVAARAGAAKFSFGGASGVVPWSITQATLDASDPGAVVTIKYDSTGGNNGNFGAIRIDGNGASDYEDAAKYGSTTEVCAATTPGCSTALCPGSDCAESAPECDGPECQPKTGNMTGPTRDAVDFRLDNTSTECESFEEVFSPLSAYNFIDANAYVVSQSGVRGGRVGSATLAKETNTSSNRAGTTTAPVSGGAGLYALNPDCNPWLGPGECPTAPSSAPCSRRVIIIPVINSFGNGSSDPVTILRFALLFLEGYENGKCSGNSCEIKARFVNAELTTGALAGSFDPDAPVHFTKLIE